LAGVSGELGGVGALGELGGALGALGELGGALGAEAGASKNPSSLAFGRGCLM